MTWPRHSQGCGGAVSRCGKWSALDTWHNLPKTGMVDNSTDSYRVHMFTPRWLANALMALTAALFAMSIAHGKAFFIFYATAALFLASQVLAQSRRAGR